jgi:hypothetical protein
LGTSSGYGPLPPAPDFRRIPAIQIEWPGPSIIAPRELSPLEKARREEIRRKMEFALNVQKMRFVGGVVEMGNANIDPRLHELSMATIPVFLSVIPIVGEVSDYWISMDPDLDTRTRDEIRFFVIVSVASYGLSVNRGPLARLNQAQERFLSRLEADAFTRRTYPFGPSGICQPCPPAIAQAPTTLPVLPPGYHYRTVGSRIHVVRNPGRAGDIPAMHLVDGQLRLGPSPAAVRNTATRSAFLRAVADNVNIPSWIKPWLRRGELPPGFLVHHKKALYDGGTDTIDNMVLQGVDLHRTTHRCYIPGGRILSITPRPGSFQPY